jgi:NDP-sugar pyrophosphorylase family protein
MDRINYIFPAAGKGQRFRDAGIDVPKPLILVNEIPLLIWAISNFDIKDTDQIWIICLKPHGIREFFARNYPSLRMRVKFIEISEITTGPATTVSLAINQINDSESIIVANTDQYVFEDLRNFSNSIRSKEFDGNILTMFAKGNQWSYITKDANNEVERVVEKKQISDEATVGIYGFSESIYFKKSYEEMVKSKDKVNNEYYVAPLFNYMIQANQKITSENIGKVGYEVMGTGVPDDLNIFKSDSRIKNLALEIKRNLLI